MHGRHFVIAGFCEVELRDFVYFRSANDFISIITKRNYVSWVALSKYLTISMNQMGKIKVKRRLKILMSPIKTYGRRLNPMWK